MKVPAQIKLIDLPCDPESLVIPHLSIGLAPGFAPGRVLRQAIELNLSNIVQKFSPRYEADIESSKVMLCRPQDYFDFPVSTILSPGRVSEMREEELKGFQFNFQRGSQKESALIDLGNYLAPLLNGSAISDCLLIADELFSNAVFNAPYAAQNAQSNEVPRDDESVLHRPLKTGQLFAGSDENYLVIGCRDEYGTLDPRALIHRLSNTYQNNENRTVREGPGGAGLGTLMIFNACSGFYVGARQGSHSVLCAVIMRKGGMRRRMESPKSLHLLSV
jgi:hypothetical protein